MVHASPTVAPQALVNSAAGTTSLINPFKISPLPGAPDGEILNRLPGRAIFLRVNEVICSAAKGADPTPLIERVAPLCLPEARDVAQLEQTIAQKVADEGDPIGLG